MPSDRKPSLILPVAGAAMMLVAAYVGAYYVTVTPTLTWQNPDGRPFPQDLDVGFISGSFSKEPEYSVAPQVAACLFAPMEWLDRRTRPHVWEPSRD